MFLVACVLFLFSCSEHFPGASPLSLPLSLSLCLRRSYQPSCLCVVGGGFFAPTVADVLTMRSRGGQYKRPRRRSGGRHTAARSGVPESTAWSHHPTLGTEKQKKKKNTILFFFEIGLCVFYVENRFL